MCNKNSKTPNCLSLATILIFVVVFSHLYLNLINKWWFEDDPWMLLHSSKINNPVNIFIDKKIITGYGAGKAFAPMQIFTFWIDVKLAGFSPVFAYVHSIVSLLIATLMFYIVLLQFTRNNLLSIYTGGLNLQVQLDRLN